MTIDDAIEKQEKYISDFEKCKTMHAVTLWEMHCIEERRQLVEWLKDYKRLLEQESCEDVISRQAVLDAMYELCDTGETLRENPYRDNPYIDAITDAIYELPSVTPAERIRHCKDCKWWKDSDGVFRRGIGAESSCPFNTKEIYEGDAYCYRFESKESEGNGVLEQLAEKQNNLSATNKAWSDAIEKNGYVN